MVNLSFTGAFSIRSNQLFSTVLRGKDANTEPILHIPLTYLFPLYCSTNPISWVRLHKHWLKWKLQPDIAVSGNAIFDALRTAASKPIFIRFGHHSWHQRFRLLNKAQLILTLFLLCNRSWNPFITKQGLLFLVDKNLEKEDSRTKDTFFRQKYDQCSLHSYQTLNYI